MGLTSHVPPHLMPPLIVMHLGRPIGRCFVVMHIVWSLVQDFGDEYYLN